MTGENREFRRLSSFPLIASYFYIPSLSTLPAYLHRSTASANYCNCRQQFAKYVYATGDTNTLQLEFADLSMS